MMPEEVRPSIPKLIRACVFWGLLVIGIYVGAYAFLVQPGLTIRTGKTQAAPKYSKSKKVQGYLENFFWPVYQVDYHLRPSLWQIEFSDDPLLSTPNRIP